MIDSINRFRWQNGVESVKHTDKLIDDYCLMHCQEMVQKSSLCHTPECYLEDWGEAVAMMPCCDGWQDKIIFDIIGSSERHRNLLLHSDIISHAFCIHNYVVYVTIRGKKSIN
jgi:hypothetical protein